MGSALGAPHIKWPCTWSDCVSTKNCFAVMWSINYICSIMVLQSLCIFSYSEYGSLHLGLLMLWLFPKSEFNAVH